MSSGSAVAAAKSGQVTFAGGNPCCSYGFHIIIDHGDGYETVYAHLSDFAVGNGQFVNAGDIIGFSGNSGRSTGPHLHFEVMVQGVYQDPNKFLSAGQGLPAVAAASPAPTLQSPARR